MFRRFSVNFALFSMGLDAVLVALALWISYLVRPLVSYLPFTVYLTRVDKIPLPIYIIFPLAWVAILLLQSVYDGRKNLHLVEELSSLSVGSILAGLFLAGTLYLSFREISRALFLSFVVLAYGFLLTWRLVYRAVSLLMKRTARNQHSVLIVGAGQVGKEVEAQISKNSFLDLVVVGFLDDDQNKKETSGEILGSVSEIVQVVARYKVDDIVIALPTHAYEKVNQVAAALHSLPVRIWLIPDYFRLALHKALIEDFAGIPMLDLRAPALSDQQRMMKRAFDLTLCIFLLPFMVPLFVFIGLAIRLEGPGPIFFKQKRVGENGCIFDFIKFRTMIPEAESLRHLVEHYDENGNFIHKSRSDPRVTRVGRFLRRTSLDELPNIINILKGEMSLVGPRPELPYLVEKYEPWQRERFAVPQGMTGWWQINGRSDRPMHLNTEDDLYYVQHYSILLDLFILARTVWVVLKGRGAF